MSKLCFGNFGTKIQRRVLGSLYLVFHYYIGRWSPARRLVGGRGRSGNARCFTLSCDVRGERERVCVGVRGDRPFRPLGFSAKQRRSPRREEAERETAEPGTQRPLRVREVETQSKPSVARNKQRRVGGGTKKSLEDEEELGGRRGRWQKGSREVAV
ncbi:hypothetical protein C8F04DRAFT_1189532 [Mycena alexandri]|uniref:Uncharacterized protein n=1 Tax=Mycena alexandri TaxID=1745969 RepID=A0AAD6SGU2_9AGAR|nr:hypothetical protein C8F04DRAFT_1189532 [Mycena alexandri]